MKKLKFAGLALALAVLTGCAPVTPATQIEATGEVEVIESIAEVLQASIELFEKQGMTERVVSAGDNYILSYEPAEKFVAGLYNQEADDVLAIDKKSFFTIFMAEEMLAKPETSVTSVEGGYLISNPEFEGIYLYVENGLVVAGASAEDTWSGTFEYQPDQFVQQLLLQLGE